MAAEGIEGVFRQSPRRSVTPRTKCIPPAPAAAPLQSGNWASGASPARGPNDGSRNDTCVRNMIPHVNEDIADLGKLILLMRPQDVAKAHEFGPVLEHYAVHGMPVDCGADWSREEILAGVERGPHQLATTADVVALFQEDIKCQIAVGSTHVVDWDDVKWNMPTNLNISPVAVVPQQSRRDRIILDLSFPVRVGRQTIQQAINATTTPTSHPSALDFLGSTMPRILNFLAHAPAEYPVYFSKYDISDGFWRMVVAAGCEWNFAYVLPQAPGAPIKLVVPNALQMGRKESPGFFCSASETARDVAKKLTGFDGVHRELPMHELEELIKLPLPSENLADLRTDAIPWAAIEVFVDDFIALCLRR